MSHARMTQHTIDQIKSADLVQVAYVFGSKPQEDAYIIRYAHRSRGGRDISPWQIAMAGSGPRMWKTSGSAVRSLRRLRPDLTAGEIHQCTVGPLRELLSHQ